MVELDSQIIKIHLRVFTFRLLVSVSDRIDKTKAAVALRSVQKWNYIYRHFCDGD